MAFWTEFSTILFISLTGIDLNLWLLAQSCFSGWAELVELM